MKKQVRCISCNKEFWSKTYKRRFTIKDGNKKVVREPLTNICKACENMLRQRQMKRKSRTREITKGYERMDIMKDLVRVEMERRRKDEEANRLKEKQEKLMGNKTLLTTPFNTVLPDMDKKKKKRKKKR